MKTIKRLISFLLVLTLTLSVPMNAYSLPQDSTAAQILSSDMSLDAAKNNVQTYYSNEDWEETYPNGLYVVEYSSYEVPEGGTDPENPEDIYLGILVYRIGGTATGSTVTYSLNCTYGDPELYPTSVGEVTFMPQQTTATVKVKIKNDDVRNGDQLLTLSLTDATSGDISVASTTVIKIFDDEPYVESQISLVATSTVTDAENGNVTIVVKRTGNEADVCTFHLSTADGTAVAGVDYDPIDREIIFLGQQTEQQIIIPLIQSDTVYEQPKSFTLTISDMKGCVAAGAETIRLDITNKKENPSKELTDISGAAADMTLDDSGALADSAQSVINVNDDIDRAALLRTVMGSFNGTAVQTFSAPLYTAAEKQTGFWSSSVIVPASDFEQRYCTDGTWNHGSTFSNGNEDLLISSVYSYDLNHFHSVTLNVRNEDGSSILGNPNTAFGYLTYGGASDNSNSFAFIKSDLRSSNPELSWMNERQIYFLVNQNNTNFNYITSPKTFDLFDSSGNRYAASGGISGSDHKLFFMVYDDEGWDDTHFELSNTLLNRTAIPFSTFTNDLNGEITNLKFNISDDKLNDSSITFEMNGYRWTVMVSSAHGGGVGLVYGTTDTTPAEDRYGFYVGSTLKITYELLVSGTTSTPVPEYFYLVDSNGNIHNACQAADEAFYLPMETLMSNNQTELVENYALSSEEAADHINNTLNANESINSTFTKKLTFDVRFSLKQGISLNFKSIPTLSTPKTIEDGSTETSKDHTARVYQELRQVVTFYSGGSAFVPDYQVDMEHCSIVYDNCEFDYIRVDPAAAGTAYWAASNLYDLNYQSFNASVDISYDTCAQIQNNVSFRLYNPTTTGYLPPELSLISTSVSNLTANGFQTIYNANSLDDYITFEALYNDTSDKPVIQYYTVRFVISDIYVGAMTGDVKEFNVNVNYSSSNPVQEYPLLSFTFKGGASFDEATEVELQVLNSKFKTSAQTGALDYMPVLELVDHSANGYEYILHIPTYYNYQNTQDPLFASYQQVFRGSDGISFELNNYDMNTASTSSAADDGTAEVIDTVPLSETKMLATKAPSIKLASDEETMESKYFEEQEQFYTYTDHHMAFSGFKLNFDFSGVPAAMSKVSRNSDKTFSSVSRLMSGTGLYIQYGNNQLVIGCRISANAFGENKINAIAADGASERQKTSAKMNTASVVSAGGYVDGKVTLTYNNLTHTYDPTSFYFSAGLNVGLTVTIPVPPLPSIYVTFTTKVSANIGTGGTIIQEYIDQSGKVHYHVTWSGFTFSPALSVSAGIGAGLSSVVALEGGITVDAAATLVLGSKNYKPPQVEFDIDSVTGSINDSCSISFNGSWSTYKETTNIETATPGLLAPASMYYYCYGKTLCKSTAKGDTLVIKAKAASFQIVAAKGPDCGTMNVVIHDAQNNELYNQNINLYATQIELYEQIISWQCVDFDYKTSSAQDITVTITNTSDATISLDSVRVHNLDYMKLNTDRAYVESFSLRLALYIKLVLMGFSIGLEPGYMLIKYSNAKNGNTFTEDASITFGTFFTSETIDLLTTDEPLPVLMATQRKAASTASADYFDTGEFATEKAKTLLQADIDSSANTQVISKGEDIYTFYSVLNTDADGTASYYQLYYSKNGVEQGLVSDDLFVADFRAYLDEIGNLAVIMIASDSTVASITADEIGKAKLDLTDGTSIQISSTADLSKVLARTCVKAAVYDDAAGGFAQPQVISGTDANGLQESLPVTTSTADLMTAPTGQASVLFYVEDARTDVPADYNMNWTGFNDSTVNTSGMINGLYNSLYTGKSELRYSLLVNGSYSAGQSISFDGVSADWLKPGFKITDMDAIMVNSDTVALAYSVEVPYVLLNGYTGTLKQIHYRKGVLNADRTAISFGETVVVDSVFDYDMDLADVFSNAETIDPKYYDAESGNFYDSIILRNVQFENAVLCENGTEVSAGNAAPCLFYQTNGSINYATYDAMEKKKTVGVLYDGSFDSYVIAVGPDGHICLIYNDNTDSGSYIDTLYIIEYSPEDQLWNKPRQLTYSDVFDQEAFDNREPTASVIFDRFSAFVTGTGSNKKIAVALQSSYVPFSYDFATDASKLKTDYDVDFTQEYDRITVDEDGVVHAAITVPTLDYEAPNVRSDIFMITFEDMVTALEIEDLDLQNLRFIPGEEIYTNFTIVNTGDYMVSSMKVSLCYYHPSTGALETITSTKLTGSLLSGDSYPMEMSYTVGQTHIPDGSRLVVKITDASGRRTLFDPTNEISGNHGWPEINNCAELCFAAANVEIDSNGIMTYRLNIANAGTIDAVSNATIFCNLFTYDEQLTQYNPLTTLFSVTVNADRLASGADTFVSDTFNVSQFLPETGELYYNFVIKTNDTQYDTENDTLEVNVCQQMPKIEVDSIVAVTGAPQFSNGRAVRNLKLGDEIIIDGDILSNYFKDSALTAYEVGSACLSIDASAETGDIRVKAIDLPSNSEGYVKLLLHIKETTIYRYLYLHISNTDITDLSADHIISGWTLSEKDHPCAMEFDMVRSETDGSTLSFRFTGMDFRLYGDILSNGGDIRIEVTNSNGTTVVEDTLSTAGSLNNIGMLLYHSPMLALDTYTVTVTAELDDGEAVSLDHARFTIDTSGADTTGYAVVNRYDETLDAPMLSGRKRQACFTLNFSKAIGLAPGKCLSDITLNFAEYEDCGDGYTATGRTVTFEASQINGTQLILTSELSSTPGSILKYVLTSPRLPDDCLVTVPNGEPVKTAIPNYASVSYELKESGILSVTVADDQQMPDGSVHKSVHVKFMSAPDTTRLNGTTLLYRTTDPAGEQHAISFRFCQLTEDPRVAVYRADRLELSEEELTKTFMFKQGILLNETQYVLITARGDYLENDLTTVLEDTSQLDIVYDKLTASSPPRIQLVSEGNTKTPTVIVEYPEAIDAVGTNAYLILQETLSPINGETVRKQLQLALTETVNGNTLVFAGEPVSCPAGSSVTYSLLSDRIQYASDRAILRQYDGISVNPELADAQSVTIHSDAYISDCRLYFADGAMMPEDTALCAEVRFSTVADKNTLRATSLNVIQTSDTGSFIDSTDLVLTFHTLRTVEGDTGAYTVATYRCGEDVSFHSDEIAKQFHPSHRLNASDPVTAQNGAVFSLDILRGDVLQAAKAGSHNTTINLIPNGDLGYLVQMTVEFEQPVQAVGLEHITAIVDMEVGGAVRQIPLTLVSCKDKALTFVSDIAITLEADQITVLSVPDQFADPFGTVTSSNGIAVSRRIASAELLMDMTEKGIATSAVLKMEAVNANSVVLTAEIFFDEHLRSQSFVQSTIPVEMYLEYADGTMGSVNQTLCFDSLSGETAALYAAQIELPADALFVQFALGDAIIPYGGNSLYNQTKTLSLSQKLPAAAKVSTGKSAPSEVVILSAQETDSIESLSDTIIAVTYPHPISVQNLDGITLTAQISGIGDIQTVLYRASEIYNRNTLVFRPAMEIDGVYSKAVTVTLDNAHLVLSDDAAVYNTNSGISVSMDITDISRTFQYLSYEPNPETGEPMIALLFLPAISLTVVAYAVLRNKKRRSAASK